MDKATPAHSPQLNKIHKSKTADRKDVNLPTSTKLSLAHCPPKPRKQNAYFSCFDNENKIQKERRENVHCRFAKLFQH